MEGQPFSTLFQPWLKPQLHQVRILRQIKQSAYRQLIQCTSPDGGIGRRAGLKHQWSNPCRFDPGSGYTQMVYRHL